MNLRMYRLLLLLLPALLLLTGCEEELPIPKPRSYPRVIYPEQGYKPLEADYCNFTFAQPVSATVSRTENFFDDADSECWFDLKLDPQLNGTLHFSYYPIDSYETFEQVRDQAFELTGVHNKRASDIEEIVIHRPESNVHGIAFDVAGPAASPFQFFLTDTTNHFLRGALYFEAQVNPDSLAPVVAFVKEDIFRIVESLEWEQ